MSLTLQHIFGRSLFLAAFVAGSLGLSACQHGVDSADHDPETAEPAAVDRSELRLVRDEPADDDSGQVALRIDYLRAKDAAGPRVLELFVKHSGNLELAGHQAGAAAQVADKEVVVQARGADLVRILVFASNNTRELDSGTIAHLRMRQSGKTSASAEILTDRPLMSPRKAAEGLLVSNPIEL